MNVDSKSKRLHQKHARSFIYSNNLNETGYNELFSLTEKMYEKNCIRKGLILKNSKIYLSNIKQKETPNWGSLHIKSVLTLFGLGFFGVPGPGGVLQKPPSINPKVLMRLT